MDPMRLSNLAITPVVVLALSFAPAMGGAQRGRGGPTAPADSTVPADLRSLLAPRRSEMRLVIQRYANDHTLLGGNYAAAQPGQGGRGGGGAGGGGRSRGGTDSTGAAARPDSAAGGSGRGGGRGGR